MDSPIKDDIVDAKTASSSTSPTSTEQVSSVASALTPVGSAGKWLTDLVSSAVEIYARELKESPIRTKAITSCAIAMLGELIGTQLKPRKADGSRGNVVLKFTEGNLKFTS